MCTSATEHGGPAVRTNRDQRYGPGDGEWGAAGQHRAAAERGRRGGDGRDRRAGRPARAIGRQRAGGHRGPVHARRRRRAAA